MIPSLEFFFRFTTVVKIADYIDHRHRDRIMRLFPVKRRHRFLRIDNYRNAFWVTKLILWLYVFVHSTKKKNFFLRNQEIFSFLCVLDPGDHFTKIRPASCGQYLDVEKFQFQIISKPFDRSPSYLVWWCKKIIDIKWYIFRWPWLKVKGQISRSNRLPGAPK